MSVDVNHRAVDVHGHAVHETVLRLIDGYGTEFGGISVDRNGQRPVITLPGVDRLRPLPKGMSADAERIGWMRSQGVAYQLIAPWMDIQGNSFDRDTGVAWATALNDATAAGLPELGDSTHLLATVYPSDPQAVIAEMLRARTERGGRSDARHALSTGLRIGCRTRTLLAAAAEHGVPVVLHVFNEEDVLWAVHVYTDPKRDVDLLHDLKQPTDYRALGAS